MRRVLIIRDPETDEIVETRKVPMSTPIHVIEAAWRHYGKVEIVEISSDAKGDDTARRVFPAASNLSGWTRLALGVLLFTLCCAPVVIP